MSPCVPKISVVTSSYNQGRFIGRTIQSVLAQDYPRVEHIVVDGMSSDETPRVLARYPHLRVIREPDGGQAEAINKGLRAATGDVLCFLNSDDTFAPGALHRVAHEIDPRRGRHVVMGRCRFIDEDDRYLGREHPWGLTSHHRMLAVWKGHCIPQPAVFWTREVYQRCGGLDEREHLVLDYDLFCRFSRRYRFHLIDQVLANYRLHAASKTCSGSEDLVLEESIRVSRRYWGPWYSPRSWVLAASLAWHRFDRPGRALALSRWGREKMRQGRWLRGLAGLAGFGLLGPDLVINLMVLPALGSRAPEWIDRLRLPRLFCPDRRHPYTEAWRGFPEQHADGWVGPVFTTEIDVKPGQRQVVLEGCVDAGHLPAPLELEVHIDSKPLGRHFIGRKREFALTLSVGEAPGRHVLSVRANTSISHHDIRGGEDYRPLSYQLRRLRLTG